MAVKMVEDVQGVWKKCKKQKEIYNLDKIAAL